MQWCVSFYQRNVLQVIPAFGARTPFVEIRLALQLISPPKKQAPPEVVQGCALPPLKGLEQFVEPRGASLEWVVETAWKWSGRHAAPEVEIPVRVLPESALKEMEKVAPQSAAIYRQQTAEIIEGNKRTKLSRTIARVERSIVDQYGWPERD